MPFFLGFFVFMAAFVAFMFSQTMLGMFFVMLGVLVFFWSITRVVASINARLPTAEEADAFELKELIAQERNAATTPIELSEELTQDIRLIAQSGSKIEAIKHVKRLTGAGLKECKDFVDTLT